MADREERRTALQPNAEGRKPKAGRELTAGLDIGGTKVSGVVLDPDGVSVAEAWLTHEATDAVGAVDELAAVVDRLGGPIGAVGVSVGGLVSEVGRVTRRGVFGFDDADIAGLLGGRVDREVFVFNDGDAALRAAIEPDRSVSTAVLFALGTGVGGSVIWRGQPLRGRTGFAGELGHIPVLDPLPYRCVCGGTGCLEQYASGRGLAERARQAGAFTESIDAAAVIQAVRDGSAPARGLIEDAGRAIAQAIVSTAVVVEPERVYLGGTIAHAASDLVLPSVMAELESRWPLRDIVPVVPLVLDEVGPYAAAVGAALLARQRRDDREGT